MINKLLKTYEVKNQEEYIKILIRKIKYYEIKIKKEKNKENEYKLIELYKELEKEISALENSLNR